MDGGCTKRVAVLVWGMDRHRGRAMRLMWAKFGTEWLIKGRGWGDWWRRGGVGAVFHRMAGTERRNRVKCVGGSETKMLRHKKDLLLLLAVQVMDAHVQVNEKSWRVPAMDAPPWRKMLHSLRHNGIRPYSCFLNGCPYRAYTPGELKVHEMAHRGGRPHVCDIGQCRQAYVRASTLGIHKKTLHPGCIRVFETHTHTRKIRPLLTCDVGGCPHKTRRPGHMELHTRRHRGERSFSCETRMQLQGINERGSQSTPDDAFA